MIDNFDRAILNIVQKDNQVTHAEIGAQVNLSASSVRRRLKAMRKAKVIEADVSVVDPGKEMIQAIVMVSFLKESPEGYSAFKQQMIEDPSVAQCYSVSGEVDMVLIVNAPDLSSYEAWGERVLMANPMIRRNTTHIVWSRIKFSMAVEF
ncbi:MAG: Lrp/AsnC family transcriptional regulator [Bacteroidota bacterium]